MHEAVSVAQRDVRSEQDNEHVAVVYVKRAEEDFFIGKIPGNMVI